MRHAFVAAGVVLGLPAGTASAQDIVTGNFIFYREAGTLHLVEHDVRMVPPPAYRREIPKDGTYQINRNTGALSLGESIAVEICEWFGWAPVHARLRISNALGSVGAVGRTIAGYARAASRFAYRCRDAIEDRQE